MEKSFKWMIILYLKFLFIRLCNGVPINYENINANVDVQLLAGVIALAFAVCSIVIFVGCLCCRFRHGFQETSREKEFRDSPVVLSVESNLDRTSSSSSPSPYHHCAGHSNRITTTAGNNNNYNNGEFTIFNPISRSSPSFNNNNIFLPNEQFINPPLDECIYGDIDVSCWFDNCRKDFPRSKLKYIKEIGNGWFGKVVEGAAKDIESNNKSWQTVIVRILDAASNSRQRILFLNDATFYLVPSHPNILALKGQSLRVAPLLLLQEYCSVGNFKSYLRNGNRESNNGKCLQWCCQITAGLKHLHENGFVHPDLATRNCLLTENFDVKIGDYGMGPTMFPEDYYRGEPAPTALVPVRWRSPESLDCTATTIQPKKQTVYDNIWTLAVVMWEICENGAQPYGELIDDDDVILKVFSTEKLRLERPKQKEIYTEYLYSIMQMCWIDVDSRPKLSQIEMMLSHLLLLTTTSPNQNQNYFDERWQSFKPNKIVKTDNFTIENEKTASTSSKHLSQSLNNLHGSLDNLLAIQQESGRHDEPSVTSITYDTKNMIYNKSVPENSNELQTNHKEDSSSGVHFKLGPTSNQYTDQFDSLTDSMIYKQQSSGDSETEEENWRKKVERGAYSEKVKLKSRSVTDLMVLTHVDAYSESDTETPLASLDYRSSSNRSNNSKISNLETTALNFSSEGNLLDVEETFQQELRKLQCETKENNSLLFVPDKSQHHQSNNLNLLHTLNDSKEIQPDKQVFNVFNVISIKNNHVFKDLCDKKSNSCDGKLLGKKDRIEQSEVRKNVAELPLRFRIQLTKSAPNDTKIHQIHLKENQSKSNQQHEIHKNNIIYSKLRFENSDGDENNSTDIDDDDEEEEWKLNDEKSMENVKLMDESADNQKNNKEIDDFLIMKISTIPAETNDKEQIFYENLIPELKQNYTEGPIIEKKPSINNKHYDLIENEEKPNENLSLKSSVSSTPNDDDDDDSIWSLDNLDIVQSSGDDDKQSKVKMEECEVETENALIKNEQQSETEDEMLPTEFKDEEKPDKHSVLLPIQDSTELTSNSIHLESHDSALDQSKCILNKNMTGSSISIRKENGIFDWNSGKVEHPIAEKDYSSCLNDVSIAGGLVTVCTKQLEDNEVTSDPETPESINYTDIVSLLRSTMDAEISATASSNQVAFDLSENQDKIMPNPLTHMSLFTSISSSSSSNNNNNSLKQIESFPESPPDGWDKLNYSLESWYNFLKKSLDQNNDENVFDSFIETTEPESMLYLPEENDHYRVDEETDAIESVKSINNETEPVQTNGWEAGGSNGGWYLHPQSDTKSNSDSPPPPAPSNDDVTNNMSSNELQNNKGSYVGFGVDDEIMAAIRNELLQKLPQAQGGYHDNHEEDELDDGEDKTIPSEVILRYNVYNTPLSPIPEEETFSSEEYVQQQQHPASPTTSTATIIVTSEDEVEQDEDSSPNRLDDDLDIDWTDNNDDMPLPALSHNQSSITTNNDSPSGGMMQPHHQQINHRHTPSQDSCCSNDTLFNLDDLILCTNENIEKQSSILPIDNSDINDVNEKVTAEDIITVQDKSLAAENVEQTNCSNNSSAYAVTNDFLNSERKHTTSSLPSFHSNHQVAPLPSPEDKSWKPLTGLLLTTDSSSHSENDDNDDDDDGSDKPTTTYDSTATLSEMTNPTSNTSETTLIGDDSFSDKDGANNEMEHEKIEETEKKLEKENEQIDKEEKQVEDLKMNASEMENKDRQTTIVDNESDKIKKEEDIVQNDIADDDHTIDGGDSSNSQDIFGILTDIRFNGPLDSQLMSTSFSESNEMEDEEEQEDWDSGSDTTRSSSSGEFIWKEGEHEEHLKALKAVAQDPISILEDSTKSTEETTTSVNDRNGDNAENGGVEDNNTSSDEEEEEDGAETSEFVPSTWDKYATPTKSAFRSPEKSLERSETKRNKAVWFKKQKYHNVYEYPKEPDSPIYQHGHHDLWRMPYDPFSDYGTTSTTTTDSSSHLSDDSSQFFPGGGNNGGGWWTPDSGLEDVTTPSSSSSSSNGSSDINFTTGSDDNGGKFQAVSGILPLKKMAEQIVKKLKEDNDGDDDDDDDEEDNNGKVIIPDVLGGLRHTRDKLKLDLPPSPSAFTSSKTFAVESVTVEQQQQQPPIIIRDKPTFSTFGKSRFLVQQVDTPNSTINQPIKNVCFEALPYKPLLVEDFFGKNAVTYDQQSLLTNNNNSSSHGTVIVNNTDNKKESFCKGEANLLDSADEDSGIESSTLERKVN